MQDNITRKVKEGFIGQRMFVLPPDVKKLVARNSLIGRFYFTAIGFYPKAIYHDRKRKQGSAQYILLYCVDGSGYVYIQDKTIRLDPNTWFIIPKNVAHHYHSSNTDPWSIYWVHFTGEQADLLYHRYQQQSALNSEAVPYDEKRVNAFTELLDMVEHSVNDKEAEIINIRLLGLLASFIYQQQNNQATQSNDAILNSITFMKSSLHQNISLDQFAARQQLSVSHYCRLFMSKTGLAPRQYFNQLKIWKACQYLYFSDMHVKEIAASLSFNDPFYFSRLFKKVMGVSPAKYKNQHKRA